MEKISVPWKTVKGTWDSSLLKKIKFWDDGIMKLPEKWQKVMEQKGENGDSLIHQRAESRSKKNYNPAAYGMKTTITER